MGRARAGAGAPTAATGACQAAEAGRWESQEPGDNPAHGPHPDPRERTTYSEEVVKALRVPAELGQVVHEAVALLVGEQVHQVAGVHACKGNRGSGRRFEPPRPPGVGAGWRWGAAGQGAPRALPLTSRCPESVCVGGPALFGGPRWRPQVTHWGDGCSVPVRVGAGCGGKPPWPGLCREASWGCRTPLGWAGGLTSAGDVRRAGQEQVPGSSLTCSLLTGLSSPRSFICLCRASRRKAVSRQVKAAPGQAGARPLPWLLPALGPTERPPRDTHTHTPTHTHTHTHGAGTAAWTQLRAWCPPPPALPGAGTARPAPPGAPWVSVVMRRCA